MGLPPSFSKAAQAASQVLVGFDLDSFTRTLEQHPIGIAWDESAAASPEGRATLELVVDLIARLYPEVRLCMLAGGGSSVMANIEAQIRSINPNVELGHAAYDATVVVVVGKTAFGDTGMAVSPTLIYAGSDRWIAKLSRSAPVSSGLSENVYGAGAAACFAAANVFRSVFARQLEPGGLDSVIDLSLLDFDWSGDREGARERNNPPLPRSVDLGEIHLVGVGAIGHGAVWAWRRTPQLSGVLHLVDPEPYDDTNPQRYVETVHNSVGQKAAAAAARKWMSGRLRVIPHEVEWAEHMAVMAPASGWEIDRVALALDTADDRVMVQAALPKHIHNAWTRPENLGVSRHDFLAGPCVCCFYMPSGARPNHDELVAHSLHITDAMEVKKLRFYLDTGTPLDEPALQWIGDRLGLSPEKRPRLLDFLGRPLEALYVRGICGGLFLSTGGSGESGQMEVPLAFQSALAGILLAAEVVIDAAGLRSSPIPPKTEINVLRPLGRRLNSQQQRPADGGCLCQDADYVNAYQEKYSMT